jgi:hypothetical protein
LLTAESDHGRIRSRSGSLQTAHSRGKEVGKSIIEEAAHEEEEGEEMESFLLQASPELFLKKRSFQMGDLKRHGLSHLWLNLIPQEHHGIRSSQWDGGFQSGKLLAVPQGLKDLLVKMCRQQILNHFCDATPTLKPLFPTCLNNGVGPTPEQFQAAWKDASITLYDNERLLQLDRMGLEAAYTDSDFSLGGTLKRVLQICFEASGSFYLQFSLWKVGIKEPRASKWKLVVISRPGLVPHTS